MELSDDDIREFIDAWKEAFSEKISQEEAHQYGSQLLELYGLLARAVRKSEPRQRPHNDNH